MIEEAEKAIGPGHADRALESVSSKELRVGDVMHPGVIFCAPESPLRHAARLMARHRVHAIVVLGDDEEGGLWGVVSDADLVQAIARQSLGDTTAGGMARTPLVTILREETVAKAAALMSEHSVTHLLVVDQGDRPIGVVSTLDLARAAAAGLTDPARPPAPTTEEER
ncbi:MAG TPA: CBS domain-containing protein [Gaiellaceae bacterium]|nr:CBS domain-containing protein [Gaiellaceae bacterium]